jgi:hypothetical protein
MKGAAYSHSFGSMIRTAGALIVLILGLASPSRADQTPQQAADLLTTGQWTFHGVARTFHRDGTMTSSNGAQATWTITNGVLVIMFPTDVGPHRYSLPIDPAGTHGLSNRSKPEELAMLNAPGPFAPTGGRRVTISGTGIDATVIDHIPASTRTYVGSPSIVIMPDGSYVASHDYFGPASSRDTTVIFASKDRGVSWSRISLIKGQWWSTLFLLNNSLYIMGVNKSGGSVVIRRSTDAGHNWTNPSNAISGFLLKGKWGCAPGAVVIAGGRVWRTIDNNGSQGVRSGQDMMSAPVTSDLLAASNWTTSSPIFFDAAWLQGKCDSWFEGNAVLAPDGHVVDVPRVDYDVGVEKSAIIHFSADGLTSIFDPHTGLVDFPGGSKKFTIRFDPVSKLYWSLVNPAPASIPAHHDQIRNTLALSTSPDLVHWTLRSIIAHNPDTGHHGYQYADWQFDGDDLIAVVRTSDDDDSGGANSWHNANYLTFYRIHDFRRR